MSRPFGHLYVFFLLARLKLLKKYVYQFLHMTQNRSTAIFLWHFSHTKMPHYNHFVPEKVPVDIYFPFKTDIHFSGAFCQISIVYYV